MPKRVSGTPNRQPSRKPKKRAPAPRVASPAATPTVREVERPQQAESIRRPLSTRVRAAAAPVVDYHYVINDLKRVGLIALAMFVVLGLLAVFLH